VNRRLKPSVNEPLVDAREDAFRLEASGWKMDEGTSICSDASVHRFYTLLTESSRRPRVCGCCS
jgi:hypothetical protein